MSYIPQYFLIKFILIIWLMSPTTRGACIVYKKALRPVFIKYKDQLQDGFNRVGDAGNQALKKGKDMASDPSNISKVAGLASKATDYLNKKDD